MAVNLHYMVLKLSTLGKIFSEQHFEIFFFPRRQDLAVHANCLLKRQANPVYWKNKKNITNLASAELAPRVVNVKIQKNKICIMYVEEVLKLLKLRFCSCYSTNYRFNH